LFPIIVTWIITCAAVSQAVAGEDTLNGADGGERSETFLVEEILYGLGSAGNPLVVEMEPFYDDDLFDLVAGAVKIRGGGLAHGD
jgi:hypothetical protein